MVSFFPLCSLPSFSPPSHLPSYTLPISSPFAAHPLSAYLLPPPHFPSPLLLSPPTHLSPHPPSPLTTPSPLLTTFSSAHSSFILSSSLDILVNYHLFGVSDPHQTSWPLVDYAPSFNPATYAMTSILIPHKQNWPRNTVYLRAELIQHDDGGTLLVIDETPEVYDCVRQRHLCQ